MKSCWFIAVFIFAFTQVKAFKIHREVNSLAPYYQELDHLSDLLKTSPRDFKSNYSQLLKTAQSNDDNELTSVLYIYNGSYFYYRRVLDSSRYYFDQAIQYAAPSNNGKLKRTASIRRIFCDEYVKSALELSRLMQAQLKASEKNKDTINIIYSLNGLGLFYSLMDSTEQSMKQYYRGLELAEKNKNFYEQGFILNNIGLSKLGLRLLDDAYQDFKKGLIIAKDLNNIILEGHLRQNMGYYFLIEDSLEEAEKNYLTVKKMGEENNYPGLILSSLINLGALEKERNNIVKSDSLYTLALKLAYKEAFAHAISSIYLGKAQAFISKKHYEKALPYIDSAKNYEEYTSTAEIRKAYYAMKSNIYEKIGNYKKALVEYKNYKEYVDSLNEVGNMQKVAELQYRYNDEKKEKQRLEEKNRYEIEIREKELQAASYRQNLIVVLILLSIIISSILIYHYRSKQKKNAKFSLALADKLEEERSRIARDLHDGLGQNLIILKNKYHQENKEESSSSKEIEEEFSKVIEDVRTISRSLLPPELKRLGLKKAIENMLNTIEKSTQLHVHHDLDTLDDIQLNQNKAVRIYRIIQELTTNTIKHANATAIKIDTRIVDKELKLTYQDNGQSFDLSKWKSSENSVGLRSIMQRLGYLKGSIKFEKPKKGFKVIIGIKNIAS